MGVLIGKTEVCFITELGSTYGFNTLVVYRGVARILMLGKGLKPKY